MSVSQGMLAVSLRPAAVSAPARSTPLARAVRVAARSSAFTPSSDLKGVACAQRPAVDLSRARRAAVVCSLRRPAAAVADGSGKLTILVAEKLGKAGIDMLRAYGTVVEAFDMSQADLCAKVSLCDALIVRSATKVRSHAQEHLPGSSARLPGQPGCHRRGPGRPPVTAASADTRPSQLSLPR